jgi:hypothetical protein
MEKDFNQTKEEILLGEIYLNVATLTPPAIRRLWPYVKLLSIGGATLKVYIYSLS